MKRRREFAVYIDADDTAEVAARKVALARRLYLDSEAKSRAMALAVLDGRVSLREATELVRGAGS